jgi:hypothetical protein
MRADGVVSVAVKPKFNPFIVTLVDLLGAVGALNLLMKERMAASNVKPTGSVPMPAETVIATWP